MDTERMKGYVRRGQALMELAFGLFALTLVVSALCFFAVYIAKSLKMQNSLRTGASSQTDQVECSSLTAKYVSGTETMTIKEKVELPQRTVINYENR